MRYRTNLKTGEVKESHFTKVFTPTWDKLSLLSRASLRVVALLAVKKYGRAFTAELTRKIPRSTLYRALNELAHYEVAFRDRSIVRLNPSFIHTGSLAHRFKAMAIYNKAWTEHFTKNCTRGDEALFEADEMEPIDPEDMPEEDGDIDFDPFEGMSDEEIEAQL